MEFLPHMKNAQDPSKQAVATQRKSQDSEGGGRGSVISILGYVVSFRLV